MAGWSSWAFVKLGKRNGPQHSTLKLDRACVCEFEKRDASGCERGVKVDWGDGWVGVGLVPILEIRMMYVPSDISVRCEIPGHPNGGRNGPRHPSHTGP